MAGFKTLLLSLEFPECISALLFEKCMSLYPYLCVKKFEVISNLGVSWNLVDVGMSILYFRKFQNSFSETSYAALSALVSVFDA